MLIPEIFHGDYKDTKRQVSGLLKKIIRGGQNASIKELVSNLAMLDTNDNSDLIITDRGQMPASNQMPCFMIFMLAQEVSLAGYSDDLPNEYRPSQYKKKPLSVEQEESLFFELIKQPWGLLSVISEHGICLGYPFTEDLQHQWKDIHCKMFMEELFLQWNTLEEVGNRYINTWNMLRGSSENGPLTSTSNMLAGIFCNLGLEESEVKSLLLRQEVPQLIHKVKKSAGWL